MHTLAESIHPFGDDSHVTRYMYHLQDNTQFDLDPFHLLNHLMQPRISGRAADMMQRIKSASCIINHDHGLGMLILRYDEFRCSGHVKDQSSIRNRLNQGCQDGTSHPSSLPYQETQPGLMWSSLWSVHGCRNHHNEIQQEPLSTYQRQCEARGMDHTCGYH
jgi:hypothetical protein